MHNTHTHTHIHFGEPKHGEGNQNWNKFIRLMGELLLSGVAESFTTLGWSTSDTDDESHKVRWFGFSFALCAFFHSKSNGKSPMEKGSRGSLLSTCCSDELKVPFRCFVFFFSTPFLDRQWNGTKTHINCIFNQFLAGKRIMPLFPESANWSPGR